jgi:hypothetical protein
MPDRLQGTAQIDFDEVRAIRREVKDLRESSRSVRARHTTEEISEDEDNLARQEAKLRRLGVLDIEPVTEQINRQERKD